MSKTFEVSFLIGAALAGTFKSTLSSAKTQISKLGQGVSQLDSLGAKLGRADSLTKSMAATRTELAAVQRNMTRLGSLSMSGAGGAKIAAEFDKAAAHSEKLKQSLARQSTELRTLKGAFSAAGVATGDFAGQQAKVGSALADLRGAQSRILETQSARQANLDRRANLRGQLLDAAGMGMTLAVPVRIAASFEQAMARTGAVAGLDLAGEEFRRLTATSRELGATTNWSASEAAEGMQYLAMAGFEANQIISAMPGMLSLASAGAIDLGSAADIASNILSGFNLPAEEMGRLGDVLTNTFTSSNTSLEMLGQSMKYVAPVAQSLGVSVEMTAAMVGKLGDVGIQGSQAGTALRAMLSRLASLPEGAAGAMKKLGVATTDAAGNLRDMPSILAEMDAAMQSMGSGERAKIMSKVFGVEAMSAATELMKQASSGELTEYAESLARTGSAAEVAQKQNQTMTGRLKQLRSATEDLAITTGNVLMPAIGWVAQGMTKVAGVVRDLADKYPVLTTSVVAGVGGMLAFGAASIGLRYAFTFLRGGFLSAKLAVDSFRGGLALLRVQGSGLNLAGMLPQTGRIAGLSGAFTNLGGVLPAVAGGIKAIGLALVTNPIGIAVMAIAGAAFLIWKYWGPIKSFFVGLWQGISEAAAPAVAAVTSALEGLRSIPGVERAIGLLGQLWDLIKSVGSGVGEFLGNLFTQDADPSAEAQSMGQQVGTMLVDGIKFAFLNFTPLGWVIQAWEPVTAFLSSIDLADAGRAILETLKQGILSAAGAVVDAVKGVFDRVKALLPGSDAKEGPLSALTASGRAIPATVGQGIAAMGATPLTAPLTRAFGAAQGLLDSPLAASMGLSMDTARPSQAMSAGMSAGVQALLTPGAGGGGGGAGGAGPGGGVVIHFAPQITVNGAGDPQQTAAAVQSALEGDLDRLREHIAQINHQNMRLRYA